MSNDIEDIKLTGKVMWAIVQEPEASKKSRGKKSWSLDIEVSQETVKMLLDKGVKIGQGQYDKKLKVVDGVTYLAGIKRPELNSKGIPVKPLKVIGLDRQPFTEDVGNGSVCTIRVALIPVDGQTIMYLKAVLVKEHVPYNTSKDFDDGDFGESAKVSSDEDFDDDDF